MKKKEFSELKNKAVEKLWSEAEAIRLSIFRFKAELRAGKEKNFKKGKNLRKDLSQILTVIKEKEMTEKQQKAEKGKEAK